MAAEILRANAVKQDGYCVRYLGWCVCRIEVGSDNRRAENPVESGFASEGAAEQAFRDKYAEHHGRIIRKLR